MRRFFDWFLRDRRNGRIVVAQWPNPPLWLFAGAGGLSWLLPTVWPAVPEAALAGLRIGAAAALAWWAVAEVATGVNPWRRCLGGGVLIAGLARVIGAA